MYRPGGAARARQLRYTCTAVLCLMSRKYARPGPTTGLGHSPPCVPVAEHRQTRESVGLCAAVLYAPAARLPKDGDASEATHVTGAPDTETARATPPRLGAAAQLKCERREAVEDRAHRLHGWLEEG